MMSNRKLVHVISSLSRGGAEQILVSLCTALAQEPYTYQQTVIFFYDGPLRQELEKLGIVTIQIHPFLYGRLYNILRALKPDSVHSSLWLANITMRVMCAYLKIPLVCALHNLRELDGPVRTTIARMVPYQATRYCAVSDAVAQSYTYLPTARITTVPNGVAAPIARSTKFLKKNCFIIGAVGRFISSKNYLTLIQVFAGVHKAHPHARLFLLGHGPHEHALRTLVEQLHLTGVVTFIINKPAQQYYHVFDCFVHPSRSEGFGLSAAEAAAHGVPTIVTPDATKLREQLIAHIENPEAYCPAPEKYSLTTMVSQYNELFQLNR